MSDTIHLNSELNDIELEEDNFSSLHNVFIENISYTTAIFIFSIFILFNSIYVYSGICSPSSFNTTTIYYPLAQDYDKDFATVQILLKPLHIFHRFVNMNGRALRNNNKDAIDKNIILDGKLTFLKGGSLVEEKELPETNIANYFEIGTEKSSEFHVFIQPIYSNFDSLNISLVLKYGILNIRGLEFSYTFSDPLAFNSLSNSVKIILPSSACYAFVSFLFCLKGNHWSLTQILSFVLVGIGIFVSNPFAFLANNKFLSFCSDFVPSIFFAVFRFFFAYLAASIFYRSEKIPKTVFLILIGFFSIYGLCEFSSTSQHDAISLYASDNLSFIEKVTIFLHILYSIIIPSSFAFDFVETFGSSKSKKWHFKSVVYGIFSLATCATTLISEVVIPISGISNDKTMRLNLYFASHVFASIALLFLHHPINSFDSGHEGIKVSASNIEQD